MFLSLSTCLTNSALASLPSACLPVHQLVCTLVSLSACLSADSSVHQLTCLLVSIVRQYISLSYTACLLVHQVICPLNSSFVSLSANTLACLSARSPAHLSACLPVHQLIRLLISPLVSLSTHFQLVHISILTNPLSCTSSFARLSACSPDCQCVLQ